MTYEAFDYDELVRRTALFQSEYFERNQAFMAQLAEGQQPKVMLVGCVDSRVVPEYITKARPGDVFVLRSIANIIPSYSISESAVGAAIEYAVRHLQIAHLVVCGHTECGGLKALDKRLDTLKEPGLARWLEHARPAQQRVQARGLGAAQQARALVEENVALQLEHAQTYACVREALQKKSLALHGWVYDILTGQVSVL